MADNLTIHLTKFRGTKNARLTKEFTLNDKGEIQKNGTPNFSYGQARKLSIKSLSELEGVIAGLKKNECISCGEFDIPFCEIFTKDYFKPEDYKKGARTRTKDHMSEPALKVALLDYDPSPNMPEELVCHTPDGVMKKLSEIIPEFEKVAWSATSSSSHGLHNLKTGEHYTGNGGMHLYIATTLPLETLQSVLEVRLWKAGKGYIDFASSGAMLERTLVDLSVLSPERLIYEADPVLGDGIGQEPRVWGHHEGEVLSEIQPLTDQDFRDHQKCVCEAKNGPENKEIAESKLEAHYRKRVTKMAALKEVSEEEASKLVKRPTTSDMEKGHQNLTFNDIIEIDGQLMLISELYQRGDEFNGKAMPDPIEGSEYGKTTAKFYFNDGFNPCIFSFAHGRKTVFHIQHGGE